MHVHKCVLHVRSPHISRVSPCHSVVRELTNEVGPLPISASGRPLQEVLAGSPQLQFVGSKPSSICLTLVTSPPPATERSIAPPTPHKNTRGILHDCMCCTQHVWNTIMSCSNDCIRVHVYLFTWKYMCIAH